MKKKLDIGNITNELSGASLFFSKPVTPPPVPEPEKPVTGKKENSLAESPFFERPSTPPPQAQKEENQDQERSFDRTFERPNERSNERSNARPVKVKREKIRHTFDIYRDQLVTLQMIQLDKFQAGKKKPKLGKMVAEGIDLFIKQEASKKKRA
jgi:hypothetical protein